MKKIAFYGKGGIGKSTTAANVSAAFSKMGKKVCQIGCDPKNDSTRLLLGQICRQTVLDLVRDAEDDIQAEQIVHTGFNGIKCVEAGGPEPGVGCAGRGIIVALEKLKELDVLDDEDLVLYDVLGDVVCGGFAVPIREGYATDIYIVSSGELMALYAANNIAKGVKRFAARVLWQMLSKEELFWSLHPYILPIYRKHRMTDGSYYVRGCCILFHRIILSPR